MTSVGEIVSCLDGASLIGASEVRIVGVTHDSRMVKKGDLFAVMRGQNADGRRFVDDAIAQGASALLVDAPIEKGIPQIVVPNVRRALGRAASVCHGEPTEKLDLVAVTGTNGKTTIVYLVESVLKAQGARPGVISTVEYRVDDKVWPAPHTTPESTTIQRVAADMVELGATHLVMEASSHGLVQHRLAGCRVSVAAFTNLTQDHLDFHGTMAMYGDAKMLLFTEVIAGNPDARVVINIDDSFSENIIEKTTHSILTVSIHPDSGADICPICAPKLGIEGIEATLRIPGGEVSVVSPLIGAHNLSNLLVALGISISLGVEGRRAAEALGGLGAPGRLERVSAEHPFAVLVDYAHTPDALTNVLRALKPLTPGRLISVFGCGGDRDGAKRPLMGEAVRRIADVAVVTSDNPRTEDPDAIIEMILPGVSGEGMPRIRLEALSGAREGFAVESDRRRAIGAAIRAAEPGDTILIAGKGHEDYQILGTEKIHFDDREEARRALDELKKERI